jgi:hypothetical protein
MCKVGSWKVGKLVRWKGGKLESRDVAMQWLGENWELIIGDIFRALALQGLFYFRGSDGRDLRD